eukprot:CAMPEP_0184381080 /NCGR_PEP_ID=MMETSP0007-20130409/5270_1 /TAXON_ID=97485 /ORGANISM="Prymnesium parvum, Strain Texoma1" /LENGTH=128 /DNA_ID=CAMNT_0026726581 /DNA_START=83 /DNA_END=469 /DNA_ORIENTATION=+
MDANTDVSLPLAVFAQFTLMKWEMDVSQHDRLCATSVVAQLNLSMTHAQQRGNSLWKYATMHTEIFEKSPRARGTRPRASSVDRTTRASQADAEPVTLTESYMLCAHADPKSMPWRRHLQGYIPPQCA